MKIGPKTGLMLQKIHLKSWENAAFGLTSIYNICYNNLHGKNAKGAMTAEVTEIHPGKGDREFRASIIQHIGWNTEFSWCNATTAFSRCETATITLAVRKRTRRFTTRQVLWFGIGLPCPGIFLRKGKKNT